MDKGFYLKEEGGVKRGRGFLKNLAAKSPFRRGEGGNGKKIAKEESGDSARKRGCGSKDRPLG